MPKLRCSAEGCMSNTNQYCSRGEIQVSGQSAGTSQDTCCANFSEGSGNARNAIDQATIQDMDIQCDAQNCMHNNSAKCHAESIDVSGYGACKCDDTCCSSFKPQ